MWRPRCRADRGLWTVEGLGPLVERALQVTATAERDDLSSRLRQTRRRLADPDVRVLVVGEFKQGKSLLVNATIGAPVCPVDDDIATAVPTVVRYGAQPSAALVYLGADGAADDAAPPAERRPVPLDQLADYVSEAGNPHNERRLAYAEAALPRRLLADGLVLVDTPGVGGIGSPHAASTIAALPSADAVLLVSDAAQEYSEPEIAFLRHALQLCPNVACVLTKTDLYPHWRRVAELDRVHLGTAGIDVPLFPVSSTLRLMALQSEDQQLHEESGFGPLVRYLQRDVAARADVLAARSVAHDVDTVTDHLAVGVQTELAALRDPESSAQLLSGLEAARARADELRKRSARWQQTLSDGVADLMSDIDYDLRDRTRLIVRDAEEMIDEADPGQIWEQFGEWLDQRVAAAVADDFTWAHERSEWLAAQVAEHFSEEGLEGLPELHAPGVEKALEPVPALTELDPGTTSFAGKVLIGMRGSYGGVLMFGLLTGVMGMALINPISLGAGVIIGTKAYRDDKENKLAKRRMDARNAVRKHIDEVVFQVSKESKDRLRLVQRTLRDHFTAIADELHRSLSESMSAAQRASRTAAEDRERRITELSSQLARLEELRSQTRTVTGTPPRRTAAAVRA